MNPHRSGVPGCRTTTGKAGVHTMLILAGICLAIIPAGAVTTIISPGDQVFIGEEALNITAAVPDGIFQIAWFSPGSNPGNDAPAMIISVGDKQSFYVAPSQFGHATGTWYLWNQTVQGTAFQVLSPNLNLRIWDQETDRDISGMSVAPGSFVNFRVETNLVSITQRSGYDPASDGYISILLSTPTGATLSAVDGPNGTPISLQNLDVNALPWYWVPPGADTGWDTAAISQAGTRLYPPGTYTARLDYNVNRLQDNLQGVQGISRPFPVQITLASERVTIASNLPEVIRGNPFTVTITGVPGGEYYLWVRNTGTMTGEPGSQPPLITLNQEGVRMDPVDGPYTIGAYPISTRQGVTIREDVPSAPSNGTRYYALVVLPGTGTRTVQWQTSSATDDRRYTIQVERTSAGRVSSDDISVQVVRGSVSIVAGPGRFFYLGEQVVLSGTNTESDTTYLFMTGPNLPSSGGSLTNPRVPVITGLPDTFTQVPVDIDNTWEYSWQTGNLGIDAGSYTVYVVSAPNSRNNLQNTRFSTTPITFARPFVTATIPRTVVARGDPVEITGTSTGNPSPGVAIWVFGINRFMFATVPVSSDNTFSYKLSEGETAALATGQYYTVVQHPGYTDTLDIYPDPYRQLVLSAYPTPGSVLFRVAGPGALMSSQAADALITALNSPFIDDTYTAMSFLLVNPQISLTPPVNVTVGDRITLSGTTNLAPGNLLLIEVISESFGPTPKDQRGAFSGVSGTATVREGPDGVNTWSFVFDTASFIPDTYVVRVSAVTVSDALATTTFILNAVPPTPTPTPPPTTLPPTVPTTLPTPVPTTTTGLPGLLVPAAIGLLLLLYGMRRRKT
ncbi:MAG: DUF3821 domain-containing protein [Methanomicrobiales archaeon]|nr:DUF3821 domain-containing protein [Methanomicrobiales archaeon]